jgi:acyl-CoA carboxylase subunit alpha
MVTGIDLVRLQLLVAEGEPLPSEALGASLTGHAIEARLYAEDVPAGFLPVTGALHRFSVPAGPGLRVDAGVADGSSVSVHYDPLLAKVIAHGATRHEACRRLAAALDDAVLHGVVTNRDLLVGILRDPDFRSGRFDTSYFDRHDPVRLSGSRYHESAPEIHALAAALAGQEERRAGAPVLNSLPSGWRNVVNAPQSTTYSSAGGRLEVRYRIRASREGRTVEADVNGRGLGEIVLRASSGVRVDLEVGGVRRVASVHRVGHTSYVDSTLGSSELTEEPRFPEPRDLETPGSLLASLPGTVVRTEVRAGDHVEAGTVVVVLEAMKMEQPVRAPRRGTVKEVAVSAGQVVDVGAVLVVIEEPAGGEVEE